MDYRKLITIDPQVRGGQPCVRGLSITVDEVVREIVELRMPFEKVLAKHIELTRHDILACLEFRIESIEGGEGGTSTMPHPVSPPLRGPSVVSCSHEKPDA
jgi:uncharacterized protein (DUF433 family)